MAAALVLATAAGASAASRDAPADQVWEDAARAAAKGPVDVPLLDQAVLALPAGEVFVPQPQAERLLATLGERAPHPGLVGVVLPRDPRATWRLILRFRHVGRVREDRAAAWDAEALLQAVRDASAAPHPDREIVGWTQPPAHDARRHRLAWALASRAAGAAPDVPADVDVGAELLGRDGDLSLSLAAKDAAAGQAVVASHADAIVFVAGKRVEDFVAGTDRVAPQDLSALLVSTAAAAIDTGAPAPGFARRHAKALAAGGAALLALLLLSAWWRRWRRRQPDRAPSFASTVAEPGPGVGDNRGSAPRRDA